MESLRHKVQKLQESVTYRLQAIKALSDKEYARTSRKKRQDTKKGKQHSKQPKKIAKKTRSYRKK